MLIGIMRMPMDDRPGAAPIITEAEGSVVYELPVSKVPRAPRLVLRCYQDTGEVWVSLRRDTSPFEG